MGWRGRRLPAHPPISWFDASKELHGDFRHRALRHHAHGIFECEKEFGVTILISLTPPLSCACVEEGLAEMFCPKCDGHGRKTKFIPTRWVGEQHVTEDHGFIPTLQDWLTQIQPQPWMNRSRPLSRELETI